MRRAAGASGPWWARAGSTGSSRTLISARVPGFIFRGSEGAGAPPGGRTGGGPGARSGATTWTRSGPPLPKNGTRPSGSTTRSTGISSRPCCASCEGRAGACGGIRRKRGGMKGGGRIKTRYARSLPASCNNGGYRTTCSCGRLRALPARHRRRRAARTLSAAPPAPFCCPSSPPCRPAHR